MPLEALQARDPRWGPYSESPQARRSHRHMLRLRTARFSRSASHPSSCTPLGSASDRPTSDTILTRQRSHNLRPPGQKPSGILLATRAASGSHALPLSSILLASTSQGQASRLALHSLVAWPAVSQPTLSCGAIVLAEVRTLASRRRRAASVAVLTQTVSPVRCSGTSCRQRFPADSRCA